MDTETIQNRKDIAKGWISRTLLQAGASGISVEQIADAMGVSAASLYKYASQTEENCIHLHNLIPLLNESGDFFILHELARLFGFALVPLAEPVQMVSALLKALEQMKK